MNIFISHSSKEAPVAEEMCNALERNGNRCFIAPRDIRSGFEYAEEIANGIDSANVVLLILSKAANNSPHVLREIERAVTRSIPIMVYKVEEVELTKSMEYFLLAHQWMEAGKNDYSDVIAGVRDLESSTPDVIASAAGRTENSTPHGDCKTVTGRKGIAMAVAVVVTLLVVVATIFCAATIKKQNGTDAFAEKNMSDLRDVQVGDTIPLGTYHDEDIYWRVLKISEDGTEAVLVARDVITVKAFDAPDSGCYNHDGIENYSFAPEKAEGDMELQAYIYGNSSWENSNIRTWLNSASENVDYQGQAPTSKAMADGVNGYNTEKGFLCNFTEEELSVIKITEVETRTNALDDAETVVTQDKIFLLSLEELAWFKEADVSLMAVPTAGAVANDKSSWYNDYCLGYGVDNTMWWLREPVAESSCMCYLVGNGYYEENIYTWEVGVESFGIRPAMTVSIK